MKKKTFQILYRSDYIVEETIHIELLELLIF